MVNCREIHIVLAAWLTVCYGFYCPTENGFFPDMNGCSSFYECSNGLPIRRLCEDLAVYKPGDGQCVHHNKCNMFNCTRKHERKAVYLGDDTLYALCKYGKAVAIYKCENSRFNEEKQNCECFQEGKMLNPESCQSYFECTREGNSGEFSMKEKICENGLWFEGKSNKCVQFRDSATCRRDDIILEGSSSSDIKLFASSVTTPSPQVLKPITCANCTTIKVTVSDYLSFYFPCPSHLPYCDPSKGVCQSEKDMCADNEPAKKFPCITDGIFPDFNSCSEFHFCHNGTSRRYVCPPGTAFDPRNSLCSSETECTQGFICDGLSFGFTGHPLDSRYYALCTNQKPKLVRKCADGKVFDIKYRYKGSCIYEE